MENVAGPHAVDDAVSTATEAHLLFGPAGLRCIIDVPIAAISGSP